MRSGRAEKLTRTVCVVLLALLLATVPAGWFGEPAYAAGKKDYKYDSPDYDSYSVKVYDGKGNKYTLYSSSPERRRACSTMNKMANVKWKVRKTFSYRYLTGNSRHTTILKGFRYYGLPYTQLYRGNPSTSSSKVQKMMRKASRGEGRVKGVDCSYAVSYAIRKALGKSDGKKRLKGKRGRVYYTASYFYDGMRSSSGRVYFKGRTVVYGNDVSKVGWYGRYKDFRNAHTTTEVLNSLCEDDCYPKGKGNIYSNVYAKVRPGDVLVKLTANESHVIMATGVRIKYKKGKIDPSASRIIITDQNKPNKRYVSSKKWASSWRRNYSGPYSSFKSLLKQGYLPVTCFDRDRKYNISYISKGGSEIPSDQQKDIYEDTTLSAASPVWEGHTFKGWEAEKDPVKQLYQPGDVYSLDEDVTLKALWKINKCTIKYVAGDGIESPDDQVKTYGQSLNLSSEVPVKPGYAFAGWTTERGGDAEYYPGNIYVDDSMIKNASRKTLTLYAVWEEGSQTSEVLSEKNIVDAEDVDVTLSDDSFTYDGSSHSPKVKIKYGGNKLEKKNYEIQFEGDSESIGEHLVRVTFRKGLRGTRTLSYTIKGDLSRADTKVTVLKIGAMRYEGMPLRPEPVVYALDNDGAIIRLKKGRDFTVDYEGNNSVGIGKIIISGTGNYEGTVSAHFRIRPETSKQKNTWHFRTEKAYY